MKTRKGIELDRLDWELIQQLEIQGRQTNVGLAKRLGVSESTVRRRMERLGKERVLKVVAVPNLQKIGWGIRAIVMLRIEPSKLGGVATRLAENRDIHYLARCTGNYNLIFWILCSTIEGLAEFAKTELSNLDGVQESNTVIEVELFKRTYDWVPA